MQLEATKVRNILFICTGNTCRSPMAEGQLKKLLASSPIPGMVVASAGLIALPGNPASFHAVRIAQQNSISLEGHRAQPVTAELIDQADLVVVMEPRHRQELLGRYPQAAAEIVPLRRFARYGSRERAISDPYGHNLEAYRFCFEDIKECVESLHQWLLAGAEQQP